MKKRTGTDWHGQSRGTGQEPVARRAARGDRRAGDHRRAAPPADETSVLLYGVHAVESALHNPARLIASLKVTATARPRIAEAAALRGIEPETVDASQIDRLLPRDAVHQGVLLHAQALAMPDLGSLAPDQLPAGRQALVLVLDQVTDPHNVGAILRSASAFGVAAMVMTHRHSPRLDGALAKAASGGLETVPVITVPNLARAMETLGDLGYFRIGLDGQGKVALEDADVAGPIALVLGAESVGMRRLTMEHCDQVCRISTSGALASLNVSNAAAIALHSVRLGQRKP